MKSKCGNADYAEMRNRRLFLIEETIFSLRKNGSFSGKKRRLRGVKNVVKFFTNYIFYFVIAIFLPWLMYMPFFRKELWLTLRP